jgi:hypothetical protein
MVPWTGSTPRRARQLIPTGLPRRGEVVAACAVAIVVAHVLLAQLTLVLAVVFAVVAVVSRWRLWWLLAPAAAGLTWTLAIGPGNALAGFAAGPSGILWHLAGGHLAGETGHPLAGFSDVLSWLPRQFPVALIGGAAEAALIGWLNWLHTDEWAVPPARPGLVAAVRRALAVSAVRAGAVVTREGCALGIVPATGAVAELRWAELARGALVVGAVPQDVTLAGLQVVHAALRRRKPVIVVDPGDAAVTRALRSACLATGTPLLVHDGAGATGAAVQVAGTAGVLAGLGAADAGGPGAEAAGASRLWGRGTGQEPEPAERLETDLGRVVRERSAVLLPAGSPELAARAWAALAALATDLRRIGVDGDALVWAPRGEQVPAQALAALLRDGPEAGLSVLTAATSPAAAAELGGLVGTMLIYRVADRDLAAALAPRTGTRLLPAPAAAAAAGQHPDADVWPAAPAPGTPVSAGRSVPAGAAAFLSDSVAPGIPMTSALPVPPGFSARAAANAADLVPSPVIPARALLALGQAEFILAAGWPRRRLVAPGRLVPGRLPRPAARPRSRA